MNATTPPSVGITRDVTIVNRKGLHARAAAKVVKLCGQYQCDIYFSRSDLNMPTEAAPGRSILDLLMLAAGQGKTVTIRCDGTDAQNAIDELENLIMRGFDEEDCREDHMHSLQHGCCSD